MKQFASDTANTVIEIVRDKATTEQKLVRDNVKDVQVFEGDVGDLGSLNV